MRSKLFRNPKMIILSSLAILILVSLIGPFMVPVPPLDGTKPIEQLADPDSHFIMIDGVNVHYKIAGQGEPAILLLHGTLASTYTWNEVMQPLAQLGTVIAYDRPCFGLTARPLPGAWSGESPYGYDAQVELVFKLMDAFHFQKAILVGNSMGGAIAGMAAQKHPERVLGLILVDNVQKAHGVPDAIRPWLNTPQLNHVGPLFIRQNAMPFGNKVFQMSWHAPSKIPPETLKKYALLTQAENWDQGLWQFILVARPLETIFFPEQIQAPSLVITGDDDRVAITQDLIQEAKRIPKVQLVVIPNCGHMPQEECPNDFLKASLPFITQMKEPTTNE